MANGELCIHCGYQETSHVLGRAVMQNRTECAGFESSVHHKPECPILDCDGNCDVRIATEAWRTNYAHLKGSSLIVLLRNGALIYGD